MKPIVFVKEELTPQESARMMLEKGVSSLTVGSEDSIKGIFTKTDLVRYYLKNPLDKKVVDYMTHENVYTHSAAPLFKVVKKMLEKKA